MWTVEQVAATIDHAALKPGMTDGDIRAACETGRKYRVATVCVRPSDIELAVRELSGSGVGVSTVIGFPHGSTLPEVKAVEAAHALNRGAVELDMVMNIGKFLSGDHEWVTRDIEGVVTEAKKCSARVKVILEVFYLTPEQITIACSLAEPAGADFVKTSTGFADGSATPEAVEIMVKAVGKRLGVKAAGGIRTWKDAVGYLELGCTRLGAGSTETILEGGESSESY